MTLIHIIDTTSQQKRPVVFYCCDIATERNTMLDIYIKMKLAAYLIMALAVAAYIVVNLRR